MNALNLIPRMPELTPLDLAPSSPEWLDSRRLGIGGSDLAAIIGVSPWATRYSVWRDKSGLDPSGKQSWKMAQGHAMEDTIARTWAESVGATLYTVPMLVDAEHPWRRVNLDRIAVMPDGRIVVVEVKWTDSIDDAIPTHYYVQVLFQMGMTGIHEGVLVHADSWHEPRALPVAFDADLYAGAVATMDAFWAGHVLTGLPPDPSTPDERLTVAFDKLRGETAQVDADEDAEAIRARHLEAKARKEAAEADESAARAALAEWMVEHGAVKVKGQGWRAGVITKAGNISYKAACEAAGLTGPALEAYRGASVSYIDIRQSAGKKEV